MAGSVTVGTTIGGFVLAWLTYADASGKATVTTRVSHSDGTLWGAPTSLDVPGTGHHTLMPITGLADGSVDLIFDGVNWARVKPALPTIPTGGIANAKLVTLGSAALAYPSRLGAAAFASSGTIQVRGLATGAASLELTLTARKGGRTVTWWRRRCA